MVTDKRWHKSSAEDEAGGEEAKGEAITAAVGDAWPWGGEVRIAEASAAKRRSGPPSPWHAGTVTA